MISQTQEKVVRKHLNIPAEIIPFSNDFRDTCPCNVDLIGGDQGSL